MYTVEKEIPRSKVRIKIDTIIVSDACNSISDIIIDALAKNGYEIDMIYLNSPYQLPKKELNIYRVEERPYL